MGDAVKTVGKIVATAVCSIVYGSIKYGVETSRGNGITEKPSITEKPTGNNPDIGTPEPKPKEAEEKEAEEKEAEKEDAREITNQQANTARKAAYQAAINAGATPAQAQSAADAQTPIGNYAGNYAALSSAGANARAAYRERQGYADALERETKNLEESRTREIIAAGLQGLAGGGASGLSLYGNS